MLQSVRLARIIGAAFVTGDRDPEVSRIRLTARRADCDIQGHVNNARYVAMMDLGRWDLTLRTGLLLAGVRRRIVPVVVDLSVRYRKEIRPGTRVVLETRYAARDGRKLWFSQRFVGDGSDVLFAEAWVGALFLQRGSVLSEARVKALLLQLPHTPPAATPAIAAAFRHSSS